MGSSDPLPIVKAQWENPLVFLGLDPIKFEKDYSTYVGRNGFDRQNRRTMILGEFIIERKNGLDVQDLARAANVCEIVLRAVLTGVEPFTEIPDEFWERLASALDISIIEFPFPASS